MFETKSRLYTVAGLTFRIELPENAEIWAQMGNYEPFGASEAPASGVLFTLRHCESLEMEGRKQIDLPEPESPWETRLDAFITENENLIFDVAPNYKTPIAGHILITRDFTKVYVDNITPFVVNNALMLTYAFASTDKGVLEMHSSTVVSGGFGYMFLGKSGTGKSTHSSLWLKNIEGSWLLNDDNPVIRIDEDGRAKVYGSPWSGKTPCYKNASAPIGAIVSLHQAPKNEIQAQTLPEAYGDILSSCSGLKFVSEAMDNLHETIAGVVTTIPCYSLDCLPDDAAARVCHEAVTPKAPMAMAEQNHQLEIPNEILLPEVENLLKEGKEVVLMTKGCSMLPFIWGGRDSVVLKACRQYEKGDVVLARLEGNGHYVLHRIQSIEDDKITLKGDGNLIGTEQCRPEDICGKAIALQGPRGRQRPTPSAGKWNSLPYIIRRYTLAILRRIQ